MPRFFIDTPPAGGEIILRGADARHIARVLRMQTGDTVTICDASGMRHACVLTALSADTVTARIEQTRSAHEAESALHITLCMALPKAGKMDFIIQKATELGAAEILPFTAARCVSRPDAGALANKCGRWRRIAAEAAKQCARGCVPRIHETATFSEALSHAARARTSLLLYEAERHTGLRTALREAALTSVALMVGPEGGFTAEEVQAAETAGLRRVSLGPRILRCETAPLVALTALQYESGNLE